MLFGERLQSFHIIQSMFPLKIEKDLLFSLFDVRGYLISLSDNTKLHLSVPCVSPVVNSSQSYVRSLYQKMFVMRKI